MAAADPEDNTTGGQKARLQPLVGAIRCDVDFHVGGGCDCGKSLQHKAIITVQRSGQGGIEGFLSNVELLACGRKCGLVGFSKSVSKVLTFGGVAEVTQSGKISRLGP